MKTPGEALEIAKTYWAKTPVDVFGLASNLGVGPISDYELDGAISGLIRRKPNGDYEIVVNGNHHRNRQRFTIAHEIGHFIFHRERLDGGTSDTLAYRIDGHVFPNPNIGPEQERQANNFAANLLIPSAHLRAARAIGMTDPAELAANFQVSLAAMKIKLGLTTQPTLFERRLGAEVEAAPQPDRFGFDPL